jgi:uncharacterized membrane protein
MSPEELLRLGFSKELVVFIISILPILELRGALPVAINLFHIPWYQALPLAIIGNLLPVPVILFALNPISRWLSKVGFFNRFFRWFFEHARRRGSIVKRYERIGLVLFVAVPLPFTGAWTGSVVAVLLGLSFKHAFLSILMGICIAGIIITCLSLLGWTGAIIAGVVAVSVAMLVLWRASG